MQALNNKVWNCLPDESSLVRVSLLGGFRVERNGSKQAEPDWTRRSAKTLTKLLAAHPVHSLHREQIIDVLWPEVDAESALNSFGKALHAARRALEPGLERRQDSSYLRLTDSVLALNTRRVVVDADVFEDLAGDAIRADTTIAYQAALSVYQGELLPEDRYEAWCAERRSALAELNVRLLIGLAEVYERHGACNEAADRLREAIREDPTREAAHRQLMRLYARMGTPDQSVRQFHLCEELLRRELAIGPQAETVALYQAIKASQLTSVLTVRQRERAVTSGAAEADSAPEVPATPALDGTFVGRDKVLRFMTDQLIRSDAGRVGMVAISGEAGVGKTRLLDELAVRAGKLGAVTLRAGRGAHANQFACGAFAVALEGYSTRLQTADRLQIARRYPALARIVPSLCTGAPPQDPTSAPPDYHLDLIPSIAALLTDLARAGPLLLLLGDLHEIDAVGLDLIRYLAHLAANVPLLMAGALRDLDTVPTPELRLMSEAMTRERLWTRIELRCLSRQSTDQLVRALLPGVAVSDSLLTEIYAQSRGNPLFIRELADVMRDQPLPPVGGHQEPDWLADWLAARLPARTRVLTHLRLSLVDKSVHRVLSLAAMAGPHEISLNHLRAAAAALEPALPLAMLLDALDGALRMRLLEEREGGYAFRHAVVRAALADSLPRHRRDEFRAALARCRPGMPGLPGEHPGLCQAQGRPAGTGSAVELGAGKLSVTSRVALAGTPARSSGGPAGPGRASVASDDERS